MKRLVIIIAVIVILYPQFFKEENFDINNLAEKTKDFFGSGSEEVLIDKEKEGELENIITQVIEGNIELKIEENLEALDKEIDSISENIEDVKEDEEEEKEEDANILINVPFSSQAPLANWDDPRQQDACEEAGVIMAMAWINNREELNPLVTQREIIALADWQQEKYGEHRDLYINEVRTRLFGEYYNYDSVETKELENKSEIITALNSGQIVLAPTNGQALDNPYFKPPGPERHLVVIIGYDSQTDEFITNDPGTRHGASYRYQTDILFEAILAYPSGYHEKIEDYNKIVLFVSK